MKLKKLRLNGIRNHADSTLEFEAFNVVKGGNFQGKSSIGQGISLLFTPSTMGLDATGRGYATKIMRGLTKGVITGIIQGSKHTIERTVTLNTNTSGRTDSSKCLDDPEYNCAPFERLLDNNKAALSVCLNTDKFAIMDEKDQKSLLAKLALPKQYDFPADTIAAVNRALGDGTIDFSLEPFQVIDKAYKLLYKERELANRQVKDFVIPESLASVEVDVASLQASLKEAREKQKAISKERDEALFQANGNNVAHVKLQAKVDSLSEKIKEGQERISKLTGIISKAKGEHLTVVAEGRKALDALESERRLLATKIEVKKAKLESYGKIAGAVGETCPTCQQEIDGDTVAALQLLAKGELDDLLEREVQVSNEIAALGDVTGAEKLLADHAKSKKEKNTIEADISDNTKQYEEAKAEISKLPKVKTETDVLIAFTKPLDEVDATITDILYKLQPAIAAEERKKEIAAKTEQFAKLTAKAASVDALVKLFDKDGIKAKLLKDHVGGFVDRMNIVMAAFDYKVALEIEPDFIFNVTDATGVTTPAKELSGSESLMWLVALQCAVSRAAGIGIVIADRLDTFLPEQRSKVNKVLYTLVSNGTLEQVVAIMSDTSETVPKLPNSAFFMVTSGTVKKL